MQTALLARHGPIKVLWRSYERQLRRRPLMVQMATTACLWAAGDALAQRHAEGRTELDWRRLLLTSAFGGGVIGPLGHWWYSSLDVLCARFGAPGSAAFLLGKLLVDNVVYNSLNISAFFAFGSGVLDGNGPSAFFSKMRSEFLPTFAAESSVWPPYMALIFTRVPLQHQLLAVNMGTIFDVCFLSWVQNQEGGLLGALNNMRQAQQKKAAAALAAAGGKKGAAETMRHARHKRGVNLVAPVRRTVNVRTRAVAKSAAAQQEGGDGTEPWAPFNGVSDSVVFVNSYVGLDASCTALEDA